jgi:hypothetical protein
LVGFAGLGLVSQVGGVGRFHFREPPMGMTCTLRRASAADIERLRAAPDEVADFLFPQHSAPLVVTVPPPPGPLGWILRLLPITVTQVDPNYVAPEHPPAADDRGLDLDKSWHGLHFLFTGTAWEGQEPGCFLVRGGEEIGDEDSESQPRVLDANQVRQFSAFLSSLSAVEFEHRFDPERMTALEIYPERIWKRDPAAHGESTFEYLRQAFDDLRPFVGAAAEQGDAIIVSLS